MRKGKKTRGLRDMDFDKIYDDPFFYEPDHYQLDCNIDSERIQAILKKNGKVTWKDVYAPWIIDNGWFNDKKRGLVCSNPDKEMKCVLDIHFGDWYWITKED